jgi:hypothetical protein
MAIAPAPVVVNTPDLIGYARQLKQQELERQNQLADYLGKFTKKQGALLDGVRPEVQKAWDEVEKLSIDLEMGDSPTKRAALNRAYQNYSEVAGAGTAYTNSVLKETTAAMMDPSKFNLGGRSAKDIYSQYNTEALSGDEILSRAAQPFVLDRRMEYKVTNPYEMSQQIRKDWDESAKFSFIDPKTGKYDEQDRLNWIKETTAARLRDPESQKNAALWTGLSRRQIGENGQVTDWTQVEGVRDNPLYGDWVSSFQNEVEKYTGLLVPEYSINPYNVRQDALNAARDGDGGFGFSSKRQQTMHAPFERQFEAAEGGPRTKIGVLGTSIAPQARAQAGTGFQAQDGIYSGSRQIVEFGKKNDGSIYVSYKDSMDDASNVYGAIAADAGVKNAEAQDIAAIQQYLVRKNDPRTYEFLFGNAVSSGRATEAAGAGVNAADLRAKYDY